MPISVWKFPRSPFSTILLHPEIFYKQQAVAASEGGIGSFSTERHFLSDSALCVPKLTESGAKWNEKRTENVCIFADFFPHTVVIGIDPDRPRNVLLTPRGNRESAGTEGIKIHKQNYQSEHMKLKIKSNF